MSEETLRALIRYLPPIIRLRKDLEMSMQLDQLVGVGDMAVKSYNGLQASIARYTDDPYVESLSLALSDQADDREKVAQVALAAGQMMAYIQGQLGLNLEGLSGGHTHVNAAPNIEISGIGGGTSGEVMRVVKRVFKNTDDFDFEVDIEEEEEKGSV